MLGLVHNGPDMVDGRVHDDPEGAPSWSSWPSLYRWRTRRVAVVEWCE